MMLQAQEIIVRLGLKSHPEGGYYSETYRGNDCQVSVSGALQARPSGTAIYYMLTPSTFSEFHRLAFDEIFHFYLGDAVEMFQIDAADGAVSRFVLGNDIVAGQLPQVLVKAGVWQASRLLVQDSHSQSCDISSAVYSESPAEEAQGSLFQSLSKPYGFALLGTTMAPGFDFRDYEQGSFAELSALCRGKCDELVKSLTRV
ncbi:MAG: cupin domain-containing protein [Candidatus Obscuribacterales bacterium]|nr:cupin domain-containing protein [Candidatus Obscuribacterales bacterium]